MSAQDGWEPVGQLAGGGDVWLGPSGATLPPELISAPSAARPHTVEFHVEDVNPDLWRFLAGIPPGFPLWYRPERPALRCGPIGRAIQEIDRTISERVRILTDEYGGVENVPPSELAKADDVIDWSMVVRRWMSWM